MTFVVGSDVRAVEGVDREAVAAADRVLLAVPGIIDGDRVVAASNLGWYDVDPAIELGLARSADLVLNDAEAAALGEAALRDVPDLTFVGLGTGVGGATVSGGRVLATNLFGHEPGFSDATCRCGQRGCLETVAAGWALPTSVDDLQLGAVADALSVVLDRLPISSRGPVVLTGGLVRRHPRLLDELSLRLPQVAVEPTAAPLPAKSAAAWGLLHAAFDLDPIHR